MPVNFSQNNSLTAQSVFSLLSQLLNETEPAKFFREGERTAVVNVNVSPDRVKVELFKDLEPYSLTQEGMKELEASILRQGGYSYNYQNRFFIYTRKLDGEWMKQHTDIVVQLVPEVSQARLSIHYEVSLMCEVPGERRFSDVMIKSTEEPKEHRSEYYQLRNTVEKFLLGEAPYEMFGENGRVTLHVTDSLLMFIAEGPITSIPMSDNVYLALARFMKDSGLYDPLNSYDDEIHLATVMEPYNNIVEERRLIMRYDHRDHKLAVSGKYSLEFSCLA